MNVDSAVVVALGAWCDLYSTREDSAGGVRTSFKVREFALLSDGREVTLLDDRGWSTSARRPHRTMGLLPPDNREGGPRLEARRPSAIRKRLILGGLINEYGAAA